MIAKAIKKQIPKKVVEETYIQRSSMGSEYDYECTRYRCPECGRVSTAIAIYCWNCGQKLDFRSSVTCAE